MPDDRWSPALGGPHVPSTSQPADAPALGGVRAYPPAVLELVRTALADLGIRTPADCQGRKFRVVQALLQAETGLDDQPLQAMIAHVLAPSREEVQP